VLKSTWCVPCTGFEWFYVHTIDIHSYGLLDQIDADDQTVFLLLGNEDAFSPNQDTTLDPYAHALGQVGMGIIGEALLNHCTHRGDLLIGHGDWFAADTHNAYDTDSF